jgi:hypothetical protein
LCSDTHPGAYSGQDAYTGRLVPHEILGGEDLSDEEQNAVVDGFGTLKARTLGGGFEGTVAVCATGHRTHALTRSQKGATEDGTGRGTPIVPAIAFSPLQGGRSMPCTSVSPTLEAGTGNKAPAIAFHPTPLGDSLDPISSVEVTHALGTGSKGGCATAAVAIPIISDADRAESSAKTPSPDAKGRVSLRDPGLGIGQDGDPMFTLQATKPHAVAVAMINMQGSKGNAVAQADGPSYTLNAMHGHDVHAVGVPVYEITGTLSSRATAAGGLGTDFEVAGGLQPQGTMAVRRLLPVECERLQGFPDDWTNIPWRGKPAPDGPRYKAMGNSMAVPVMRWIGQRLDRVAKGDL